MAGRAVFGVINLGDELNPEIIMIQDSDKRPPAMWKLPGGRCESEESIELALRREVEEEIGVALRPGQRILSETIEGRTSSHVFEAWTVLSNGLIRDQLRSGNEVKQIEVVTVDDFNRLKSESRILPHHQAAIEEYFLRFCIV